MPIASGDLEGLGPEYLGRRKPDDTPQQHQQATISLDRRALKGLGPDNLVHYGSDALPQQRQSTMISSSLVRITNVLPESSGLHNPNDPPVAAGWHNKCCNCQKGIYVSTNSHRAYPCKSNFPTGTYYICGHNLCERCEGKVYGYFDEDSKFVNVEPPGDSSGDLEGKWKGKGKAM